MSQSITLWNASYTDVPAVDLPKTGGGTARFTDVTPTTVTSDSDVAQGKIYFRADGSQHTGSNQGGGSPTIESLSVTPTTSQQTFNSSSVDGYKPVVVSAMPSGSATPQATISGSSASVSTGTNTITLSKTISNTPQVSAGYVASGTAGNSSVSLTASVTTKSASTIYPSTSDQTISSGTYLTGTQTIHGVSQTNLSAENIKSGTTISISNGNGNIWSVLGTYTGGGGTDKIPLLSTTSLGTLSTSSTSASDTGKTISLASSTNFTNYDMLIISIGVDTHTNSRHLCSIGFIFITGTSNISTKNTYAVGTNVWNTKLGSTGTQSSRQSSTKYGIYANSATVSNGTMTIPIYQRYNSNNTGTINGSYTARVYGVKLVDLVT